MTESEVIKECTLCKSKDNLVFLCKKGNIVFHSCDDCLILIVKK